MKKNLFVLAVALSLTFTVSCSTKQQQQSNENQQLIQGIESSVSKMGDIEKIVTPEVSSGTPQPTQDATNNSIAPKTPVEQTSFVALTAQEEEMLKLINQDRAQNNAPPLQIDMQITNIARVKAQDMIDNHYFSHYSPKYGSPFDMLKSIGVSYVEAGENIAGNQNVQNAHKALMNSPGHRKNILNPHFTHIGLGIKSGGRYGNMFSQMFVSMPE